MGKSRMMFIAGMVAGAAFYALLSAWPGSPLASAQTQTMGRGPAPSTPAAPGGQTAGVDDRKLESLYANYFRIFTTNEEVVTDFGFIMANTSPRGAGNEPDNIFDARTRLLTSWPTTKRLAESLGKLIAAYEDRYGVIRTDPPTPRAGAPAIPPPTGR